VATKKAVEATVATKVVAAVKKATDVMIEEATAKTAAEEAAAATVAAEETTAKVMAEVATAAMAAADSVAVARPDDSGGGGPDVV
jgi:hypothetical protein